ncbi:MAG TPA: indole-3-glycerol phosphate synthase TrpC [Ktedonobacterales bacterium]
MTVESDRAPATFLARITAATRNELALRQAREPLETLCARAADAPAPRDFAAALRPAPAGPARLIAEIKRASPSKGLLARDFDPVRQARAYEAGGAAAISVLTEPQFFHGSLDHLSAVRGAVSLPILRKDFLLDPYQVYEARAAGADAALLILSMLDDALAADLLGLIRALGMEALVEAHDADEVRRALALGARVIGVNNRDLRTFEEHPNTARDLRALVPPDCVYVAESGLSSSPRITQSRAWGVDAVLIGETLMRADDPVALAREFANAPGGATAAFFAGTRRPFIKVCGLALPEHARIAAEAGADAIGLVFAPMAPAHRLLTHECAAEIVAALPPPGAPRPMAAGVFVNQPAGDIAAIAARVGIDAIQLSGDESTMQCAEVARATALPVIKALREPDHTTCLSYTQAGAIILLESAPAGTYGGAGKTGEWRVASGVARDWPVVLAGGLTPENVAEALRMSGARGVDVSSGIESSGPHGQAKDPDKMRAFIAAARGARSDS